MHIGSSEQNSIARPASLSTLRKPLFRHTTDFLLFSCASRSSVTLCVLGRAGSCNRSVIYDRLLPSRHLMFVAVGFDGPKNLLAQGCAAPADAVKAAHDGYVVQGFFPGWTAERIPRSCR